jgi:hypothetical protein
VLLTHDKDYLNDRQYPFHRNPGVIILPGEEGEPGAVKDGDSLHAEHLW